MKTNLAHDRLKELLNYDEGTGIFTWQDRRLKMRGGSIAGSPHCRGYIVIKVEHRGYLAHRLAWFWVNGTWPANEIDHIDGIRTNNAISNLRDVPRFINSQNKRSANRDSRTGYLGVCKVGDLWKAQIGHAGKHHNLGAFSTPELAHEAYIAAKRVLHVGYVPKQIPETSNKGEPCAQI